MLIKRSYNLFDRAATSDNLGARWLDHRAASLGADNDQAYSAGVVRSSLAMTGSLAAAPEYTRVAEDSDNFNRANGGLGSEWTNAGDGRAGYQIVGSQIVGTASASSQMAQYTGEIGSADQYASITITDIGTSGAARQLNPWVRINGDEENRTGYGPNWRMDTGEIFIARRNANQSETVLAEFAPRAPRAGDVLTTQVVTTDDGNLISVYINNQLIGSALDNTPGYEDGTTGLAGFRNTVRGDNFTTGSLQTDGDPPPASGGPTAVADTDALSEDGSSLSATGNVLANDSPSGLSVSAVRFGATNGTVGSSLQGTYGTLLLNSNGSYTYTLANSSAAVQGLDDGDTGRDTFTYTASGPNGTASTTLTFNVTGEDEGGGGQAPGPETSVRATRAFDDFDRAAVGENLGSGWVDQRGAGLGVNGNQAYSAGGVRSSLSTTSLQGDQWAEVTIGASGTGSGARGVGLELRGSGTSGGGSERGYYFEVATDGSNTYRIYKVVGNTETVIQSATALPESVNAGDVMRFEADGSTLRAYLNNRLLTTESDGSLSSGRAGLLVRGTAPRANDFESGNFVDVPTYTRAQSFSDGFNRGNGELGGPWIEAGEGRASFLIRSNQLGGDNNDVSMMSQYTGNMSSANQYASITITDLGTSQSARQLNPWVRIEGVDENRHGYGPNWRMDTGSLTVVRRDNGSTETTIAEFSARAPRVGDVLTTEVISVDGGNLIRVYINNQLMGSTLDNTPGFEDGTTGLIGFRNTVRGDNFTTGVLRMDGGQSRALVTDANSPASVQDDASSAVAPKALAATNATVAVAVVAADDANADANAADQSPQPATPVVAASPPSNDDVNLGQALAQNPATHDADYDALSVAALHAWNNDAPNADYVEALALAQAMFEAHEMPSLDGLVNVPVPVAAAADLPVASPELSELITLIGVAQHGLLADYHS